MENMFLEGLLAKLLKSKTKVQHFLSTMAKKFRTLGMFDIGGGITTAELLHDDSSSESETD